MEIKKDYRILIWGTGNIAVQALQLISDNVKLLGFLDNYPKGDAFWGYKVYTCERLDKGDYDYIVICSGYYREIYQQLINLKVPAEKILTYSFEKREGYRVNEARFFENKWKKFIQSNNYKVIVSGISYHNDGIDANVFTLKAYNFALRGQDIFFDYQIAKLLEERGYLKTISHYIVGLCYYSFDYDMSKSRNASEIIRYYPYIKDAHNIVSAEVYDEFVAEKTYEIMENKIYFDLFNKNMVHRMDDKNGKVTSEKDFNKNYPLTVWENMKILERFLNLLISYKIRPVIVIMPALKCYTRYCPIEIKERFYKCLKQVVQDKKIQVLDYFETYESSEAEYYHVSHFNRIGAERFTKQLECDIIW